MDASNLTEFDGILHFMAYNRTLENTSEVLNLRDHLGIRNYFPFCPY